MLINQTKPICRSPFHTVSNRGLFDGNVLGTEPRKGRWLVFLPVLVLEFISFNTYHLNSVLMKLIQFFPFLNSNRPVTGRSYPMVNRCFQYVLLLSTFVMSRRIPFGVKSPKTWINSTNSRFFPTNNAHFVLLMTDKLLTKFALYSTPEVCL